VLALLAFAGGPTLAQAEVCDASCVQYHLGEGGIPKSGAKEQHPNSQGGTKPESTPHKPHQGGGEAESPETGTEDEHQGKHAGGGGGSGGAGGNGPGKGGGSPEAPTSHHDGGSSSHLDGGSSPLIPVLIAIAVLAALSLALLAYWHRRRIPVG
jgi:hypothetical protein